MNNFEKAFNDGKTCANCGHALLYDDGTAVCGVWHTIISQSSLCEKFKTPEEVRANLKAWQAAKKAQQP